MAYERPGGASATSFVYVDETSNLPILSPGMTKAELALGELDRFEIEVALALARAGAHSGDAIRTMRKAVGLSATALAELLDVSLETVSRWENGGRAAPLSPPSGRWSSTTRQGAPPPRIGSRLCAKARSSPRWYASIFGPLRAGRPAVATASPVAQGSDAHGGLPARP